VSCTIGSSFSGWCGRRRGVVVVVVVVVVLGQGFVRGCCSAHAPIPKLLPLLYVTSSLINSHFLHSSLLLNNKIVELVELG
jgi:hypothetical protein